MAQDDADYIIAAIKKSSEKEAGSVRRDLNYSSTIAADFGGMDTVDPISIAGASFLEDGSFESHTTFSVNPGGWEYSGCSGFILDYRYQPVDPRNMYYSPTSGAPVVSGSPVVSDFFNSGSNKSLYVNQSIWVSGSVYSSLPFSDIPINQMPGSNKCLLVQTTTGSAGVYNSSFSLGKYTFKASSDGGDRYYLKFDVSPFAGYIDASKFITYSGGASNITFSGTASSGYVTSGLVSNYLPFFQSPDDFFMSVTPSITFYDLTSGAISTYVGTPQTMSRYSGFKTVAYAFKPPGGTDYMKVTFTAASSSLSRPIGFLLDRVEVKSSSVSPGNTTALAAYPVGSLYISTMSTRPETLFGGNWESYGAGRCLFGIDPAQSEFNTAGFTSGSKTHSHGLSAGWADITVTAAGNVLELVKSCTAWTSNRRTNATTNATMAAQSEGAALGGSTDSETNLPPYIVAYIWRRVS